MHSAESSHDEIKTLLVAFLVYEKISNHPRVISEWSEHTRDGI
jgi:hypothetical protein